MRPRPGQPRHRSLRPSSGGRGAVPEPGLLVLPAGQCERECNRRPARCSRAVVRGDLLGPARLEGHVRLAALDRAPMGICPQGWPPAGRDPPGDRQRHHRDRRQQPPAARRHHRQSGAATRRAGSGGGRHDASRRRGQGRRRRPRSGSSATTRASARCRFERARMVVARCHTGTSSARADQARHLERVRRDLRPPVRAARLASPRPYWCSAVPAVRSPPL